MSDEPLDLDKHRGMAAKKATDVQRILTDVENNAKALRDGQGIFFYRFPQTSGLSQPPRRATSEFVCFRAR
jgi:hypothetical protein